MTTNAPAVRTKLTQALEMLTNKLASLKSVTEGANQTSGSFSFSNSKSPNTPSINIHTSKDLEELLLIHSFLLQKKEYYEQSANQLGLETFPQFKWNGYAFAAWNNDIQIRVAVVSSHDQRTKLEVAKKKLESFLTQDDQLKMALKELGFDSIEEVQ